MFSHGKPRPDANSVQGLPCKNKAFYSPETQHGRRVIKVGLVLLLQNILIGLPSLALSETEIGERNVIPIIVAGFMLFFFFYVLATNLSVSLNKTYFSM